MMAVTMSKSPGTTILRCLLIIFIFQLRALLPLKINCRLMSRGLFLAVGRPATEDSKQGEMSRFDLAWGVINSHPVGLGPEKHRDSHLHLAG